MGERRSKQKALAQNFLKSPELVRRLVGASSIGPGDTVYEIGPGRGIITAELARRAERVIAVEKDVRWVRHLRERFKGVRNVEIAAGDFLRFPVAERDYKIFASIPYNATADIVRKILYTTPVAREACLIMQKEPARKFAGSCGETLFSVLAKPYFEFRIVAHLRRTDFEPAPKVDSVLLRISRRDRPLIEMEEKCVYREFVSYGFGRWKSCLRLAYKDVFTYKQWKRLSSDLGFPLSVTPTQLSFEQWIGLYMGYKSLGKL